MKSRTKSLKFIIILMTDSDKFLKENFFHKLDKWQFVFIDCIG